jgi:SEFIR domain
MAPTASKVFISYSHDSLEHARRVLGLAERLRKDGVDAQLDQYVAGTPPEGWPRWMLDRLDWAEFVLVVCTETYYRRFRGHEEPGKGKGADWEGNLITLVIYHAKSTTSKFVPVFFDGPDEQLIPEPVSGHTHYLLDSEDNYDKLYAFLVGQAGVTPGELGSLRTLARNPVEPLRFDVSDTSTRRLPLSNLPDRNPFFTGREPVLTELQEALSDRGRAALSGLGGVGKTRTALEYAHRHLAEYDHFFWAIADSREALLSSYVTIAGLLKLPEADSQDQMLAVEAVKRWLGSHQGWLLILDNADDITMARAFFPAGRNGHVLLTTRAVAVGAVARRVHIQEMGTEESTLFLLRRAKYIPEDAPLESAAEIK